MANKRDLYEVLGIKKSASKDEIKSAYRKLAKTYHPDNKETGDEAKFKEVQEAYDILYDDQKRGTYDQFGFAAFDQAGGNPGGNPFNGGGFGGFGGFGDGESVDLGDIFSSFFGGGRRQQKSNGPRRGNDLLMRVKVDFMDTITGKDIEIPVTVDENCPSCKGTGAKNGTAFKTCPQCGGHGYVRVQRRSLFGVMEQQETCPQCGGTGKVIIDKCPDCGGKGYKRVKKNVKVHIVASINNGQQIRVKGMGERGTLGGENGDLYVEMVVKPHQFFKREGNDIHIDVPLEFADATLGKTIIVPTVYGEEKLEIPSGTQPGAVLKMRGSGVKDLRSGRPGDQYVHLQIKVPTSMSKKQKELMKEYQKSVSDSDNAYNKFMKSFKK